MLPKICEIFPMVGFEHFLQGSSFKSLNGWMYGWMAHFWCHNVHFCMVHYVKTFMVNNIILNFELKIGSTLTWLLWADLWNYILNIMHSL